MRKSVVLAADSREAMSIITKELGSQAIILETRRVKGGIEVIAGVLNEQSESESDKTQQHFQKAMHKAESHLALTNQKQSFQDTKSAFPGAKKLAKTTNLDNANQSSLQPLDHSKNKKLPEKDTALESSCDDDKIQKNNTPESSNAEDRVNQLGLMIEKLNMITSKFNQVTSEQEQETAKTIQFTSLARKGFSKDTIDKYLALSSDTKNSESFSEYLHCSLDNSSEFFRPDTDRVVYVCGPSGSGKTSSLIRLATYAKMSGLKTGVFILERHSTKSSEALKLAGRVLDMPVIHLPKDCAFERIESLVRVGATLFIDSESMLEKNLRLISLLQNIFRSDSDVKIFTALAIPSNYSGNTLQAFADQNSTLLDRIILTKTDEATPDPELLSAMIRYRMGIVSVSNSLHFFDSFAFLSPEIIDTWIHENTTNILT